MEVTKSNFIETLPIVKKAINECDFICIDCELTGLNTISNINSFDSQKEYYEKLLRNSNKFLPIQYGLCTFKYDQTLKTFKQQAYNFYVFPRQINGSSPDHRFMCQSSCIEFLVDQGFDFNKLFKEGISYMNDIEKGKYVNTLRERQKLRANQKNSMYMDKSNHITFNDDDKVKVDNIFNEIDKFIKSDENEMVLPKCNAFIRRLVYQEAPKRIKNTANLQTRTTSNKDKEFVVTKAISDHQFAERENQMLEKEENELQLAIGFTEVLKEIVNSGKPIIGHNMILDLLHTLDKFLTSAPSNYNEFKECLHCLFSKVIDTKYMASVEPFKEHIDSTVLNHLLTCMQKEPFQIVPIEVEENSQGYQLEQMKEHEAGFDAFITGICFISMWKYLEDKQNVEDEKRFQNFTVLQPYINRLFLMRLQGNPYMNLQGDDLIPNRSNVIHISFPKAWKLNDIMQLFSPFGNVFVAWIDDKSAYVGLHQKDQTALALKTLSQSDSYKVMSYAKHQSQLIARNTFCGSPHPSKKDQTVGQNRKRRNSVTKGLSFSKKTRPVNDVIIEEEEDEGSVTEKAFTENVDWN